MTGTRLIEPHPYTDWLDNKPPEKGTLNKPRS